MTAKHFREGDYKGVLYWIERVGVRDREGGYTVPDSLELTGVLYYAICEQRDGGVVVRAANPPELTPEYNAHLAWKLSKGSLGTGANTRYFPPEAMRQLRLAAEEPQHSEAQGDASSVTVVSGKQLKLMIRQQVKAEEKTSLTDDILVAAYRQTGSVREAAAFLSQQTRRVVSKDQVHRAVKRSGGVQAVLNAEDSDSIQRTVASQGCDRQRKFASPTQPPEIE